MRYLLIKTQNLNLKTSAIPKVKHEKSYLSNSKIGCKIIIKYYIIYFFSFFFYSLDGRRLGGKYFQVDEKLKKKGLLKLKLLLLIDMKKQHN